MKGKVRGSSKTSPCGDLTSHGNLFRLRCLALEHWASKYEALLYVRPSSITTRAKTSPLREVNSPAVKCTNVPIAWLPLLLLAALQNVHKARLFREHGCKERADCLSPRSAACSIVKHHITSWLQGSEEEVAAVTSVHPASGSTSELWPVEPCCRWHAAFVH